ncbi:hypothetical protein BJ138DRAFT_1147920 [Hygrophoropsis aurantiaca]|uniref:Uncharacterized protein n=1 Tax=Hygrophoropsis aurantiaca TaxID=72124 RepID=A0ACB8AIT0_9AGAM|nr:hypothetical protein BJ138DRAFT_1147920 [Hygrophoropsis aurantiaca]
MPETRLSVMSDETLVPDPSPIPTDHDEMVSIGTKIRGSKPASKPKVQVFGEIPGVNIGCTWEKRIDCCHARVHAQTVAGIHGSIYLGCYSIAVSSFYEDDDDIGEVIIYTGEGGRQKEDPETGKPTNFGAQVYDQNWEDNGNISLLVSLETGKPVRVIRGFKVVSDYAPATGYRYDGLYVVKDAWQEKNGDGLIICRFWLERLPDQPALDGPPTLSSEIAARLELIKKRRLAETAPDVDDILEKRGNKRTSAASKKRRRSDSSASETPDSDSEISTSKRREKAPFHTMKKSRPFDTAPAEFADSDAESFTSPLASNTRNIVTRETFTSQNRNRGTLGAIEQPATPPVDTAVSDPEDSVASKRENRGPPGASKKRGRLDTTSVETADPCEDFFISAAEGENETTPSANKKQRRSDTPAIETADPAEDFFLSAAEGENGTTPGANKKQGRSDTPAVETTDFNADTFISVPEEGDETLLRVIELQRRWGTPPVPFVDSDEEFFVPKKRDEDVDATVDASTSEAPSPPPEWWLDYTDDEIFLTSLTFEV